MDDDALFTLSPDMLPAKIVWMEQAVKDFAAIINAYAPLAGQIRVMRFKSSVYDCVERVSLSPWASPPWPDYPSWRGCKFSGGKVILFWSVNPSTGTSQTPTTTATVMIERIIQTSRYSPQALKDSAT